MKTKHFPGARWLMAAVAVCGMSGMAMAAEPVAGQDYEVLDKPVSNEVPDGRIGVTEVFWYGCPHCYALEEPLEAWVDTLPDDVAFERLPATMGKVWLRHATAYYAAQELGIFNTQFHRDFFDAIQKDGHRMTDDDEIAEFFTNYGVSKDAALKALNSFGVKSQLNQANARMKAYKLMGVPALVVNGQYVITPRSANGLDNMPKIAEALIEKTRQEKEAQGTN